MILRSLILTLLTSSALYANNSAKNLHAFDTICQIYTEALNSNMPKQQLSKYIFDNISNRINNKDALEAHEAIFQLDPSKRYSIFKKSAEYSTKSKWHCNSIEILMKQ